MIEGIQHNSTECSTELEPSMPDALSLMAFP